MDDEDYQVTKDESGYTASLVGSSDFVGRGDTKIDAITCLMRDIKTFIKSEISSKILEANGEVF